jgi:type IX secretion system PorP/SprF family membrane protein
VLKQKIATILILVLAATDVWAQQEPSFAHYWAMEPSFNPAAVGKQAKLNVTGAYAMTLTGFENAPKTMHFGADMPFYLMRRYHGVGVQLVNDQIGLFSHQRLMAQYAFKQPLLGGMLSIGVQGGILSEKFRGSGLDLENSNDPAFTKTDVNGVVIDLSTGLYYTHGPWYAGISAMHLTAPEIELGDRSILNISRTYYLTAGYNIQLRNPLLSIHPSVLAHTDGTSHRVNVTTRLKYTHEQKMMYAGVGYSPSNSVTALIGGFFHGITIGYSYEIYTSVLKIGNGSHELFVGYQTDLNFQKKGRNRHQSVRIL